MNKKVYISGKISGEDKATVADKFYKAAMEIVHAGLHPISPLDNEVPDVASWEEHMRADIRLMLTCDEVLALPDCQYSPGATLELYIAERLHIPIKHLEDYGNTGIC